MKPKFDPTQEYEVVEMPKEVNPKKPKFNPNQEFEILSGSEVPPREATNEIADLALQKEIADYTKDMSLLAGHGASQGFSDEALAALQTGSVSSPEYVTKRDILRSEMGARKERTGIPGAIAEAAGSVASTAAVPILKGAPLLKELGSAVLQGTGEAKEIKDIPREAAKSALIQGATEAAGHVVKNLAFDDPTKILTRSIGVKSGDIKGDIGAKAIKATDRLNASGFFKQGDVYIPRGSHTFKRQTGNLSTFLKPLSEGDLYKRATDTISELSSRNKDLLRGKMVPSMEFKRALYEGVQDLTYEPKGFNVEKRLELARDLVDTVEKDLRMKTGWSGGGNIPAEDVEIAKQSLDAYMKDPTFDKRLLDLGIDKQGMMKFRTKLDDVLDSHKIGGMEYKKNNDMLSDLITVKDTLEAKEAGSYVDTGSRRVNVQNWWDTAKEAMSPTYVDIARSDITGAATTPIGKFGTKVMKRAPVERFTGKREPQSTMITPREIIDYKIPRTTQGILENKEKTIAKLVQNNVPPELVDTIAQALNGDPEDVANIAPLVVSQFPNIFEKSKYQVFDGIIAPSERAKAADAIAKREDMNSVQRAKAINDINKSGKFPQELA